MQPPLLQNPCGRIFMKKIANPAFLREKAISKKYLLQPTRLRALKDNKQLFCIAQQFLSLLRNLVGVARVHGFPSNGNKKSNNARANKQLRVLRFSQSINSHRACGCRSSLFQSTPSFARQEESLVWWTAFLLPSPLQLITKQSRQSLGKKQPEICLRSFPEVKLPRSFVIIKFSHSICVSFESAWFRRKV